MVVGVVGRRGGPGEGDASEKWGKRDVYPPGEVVWVREMHPRSGKKEMHIRPERLARGTKCIREVGKEGYISAWRGWPGARNASEKWEKRDAYPPGEVGQGHEMHPRSGKSEMHIRPEQVVWCVRCIRGEKKERIYPPESVCVRRWMHPRSRKRKNISARASDRGERNASEK